MNELAVHVPDETKLSTLGSELVRAAKELKVYDAATYEAAGAFRVRCDTAAKLVETEIRPTIDAAHAAHKAACDLLKKHQRAPLEAKAFADATMRVWVDEQARVRRAEQDRLEAIERERIQAEADRLRIEATKLREEGHAKAARELAKKAAEKAAEPVIVEAAPVVAPPKVAGMAIREEWFAEIVDRDLIPREYFILDEKALNAACRFTKERTRIPGVIAKCRKVNVGR